MPQDNSNFLFALLFQDPAVPIADRMAELDAAATVPFGNFMLTAMLQVQDRRYN